MPSSASDFPFIRKGTCILAQRDSDGLVLFDERVVAGNKLNGNRCFSFRQIQDTRAVVVSRPADRVIPARDAHAVRESEKHARIRSRGKRTGNIDGYGCRINAADILDRIRRVGCELNGMDVNIRYGDGVSCGGRAPPAR